MRAADTLAALFWLAIAAGITASGWELRLGTLNDPGSGFMIFWIGVAMLALGGAALLAALRQPVGAGLAGLWAGARWTHVPYVATLLALYAWLLPWLGFLAVTVLMLIVLFRTIEPLRWQWAVAGAFAATAATWLVFGRWLGTQLPVGTLWAG